MTAQESKQHEHQAVQDWRCRCQIAFGVGGPLIHSTHRTQTTIQKCCKKCGAVSRQFVIS